MAARMASVAPAEFSMHAIRRALAHFMPLFLAAAVLAVPASAEPPAQPLDASDELAVLSLADLPPDELQAKIEELRRQYRGGQHSGILGLLIQLVKQTGASAGSDSLLTGPSGASAVHGAVHRLLDLLYVWADDALAEDLAERLRSEEKEVRTAALLAARCVSSKPKVSAPLRTLAETGSIRDRASALLALGESADSGVLEWAKSQLDSDSVPLREAARTAVSRISLALGQVAHGNPTGGPELGQICPVGRKSHIHGGYSIPVGAIDSQALSLVVISHPEAAAELKSREFLSELERHLSAGVTVLVIAPTAADWPPETLAWMRKLGITPPSESQLEEGLGVPAYEDYRSFCNFPYELREQGGDAAERSWKRWGAKQVAPVRSAGSGGALFVVQEGVLGRGRLVFTTVPLASRDVYRENFLRWAYGDALLENLAPYVAPVFRLDPSGVTPHVPWYKPGATGPVSVAWLAGKTFKRTLAEVHQRMAIDFAFAPYNAFFDRPIHTKETRSKRTILGQRSMDLLEGELSRRQVFVVSYGEVDLGSLVNARPALVSMRSLPARLQRMIERRVREGAGLVTLGQNGFNPLDDARKEWTGFGDDDPELVETSPLLMPFREDREEVPIVARRVGRGRAVWFCRDLPSNHILDAMRAAPGPPTAFQIPGFLSDTVRIRHSEYDYARLVKCILWAAGRDTSVVRSLDADLDQAGRPGKIKVALRKPTEGILKARIRNAYDEIEGQAETRFSGKEVLLPISAVTAGPHLAEITVCNDRGEVLDFAATQLAVSSAARIASLESDRRFYKPGEQVGLKVHLAGIQDLQGRAELAVQAVDGFGRVVFATRVEVPRGREELSVSIPVSAPLSRLFEIRCRLEVDGTPVSQLRKPVAVDLGPAERHFDIEAPVPAELAAMFKQQFGVDTAITEPEVGLRYNFDFALGSWFRQLGVLITSSSRTDPKVRVPCLSDPATRLRLILDAREVGEVFGPLGARNYMAADEAGHGMCESGHCRFRFRRKMRREYPSLEALNREWGTAFPSWKEVRPFTSKDPARLGSWVDYRWFNEQVFAEYCNLIEMACEDRMPGLKAGHSGRRGGSLLMDLSRLYYYYGVSERDVSIARPDAVIGAWYRPGYRFVENHETQCRHWPWWHLFRGTNKMCLWYSKLGTPAIHGDLSRPYMAFVWLNEEMDDIRRGMGKLLLHCRRDEGQVAQYTSLRSDFVKGRMREAGIKPKPRSDITQTGLDLQYECRYVSELMVERGALEDGRRRLLFLPGIVSLSGEERKAIRQFVEKGGIAVADYDIGTRNEHGTRSEDAFARDVFGVDVAEGGAGKERAALTIRRSATLDLTHLVRGGARSVGAWGTNVKLAGGSATGLIAGKVPALIVKDYGKGKGIYLNFSPTTLRAAAGQAAEAGQAPSALVRDLLSLAKVERTFSVEVNGHPAALDFGVFHDGQAVYTGFVQKGRGGMLSEEKPVDARVRFQREAHLYDCRAGRYLGLTREHRPSLTPSIAQLYASLPYRLEKVEVRGPVQVRRGQEPVFAIALETGGIPAVQHVLLLEVTGPAGRPFEAYHRRILVSGGRHELTLPIALNAEIGKWNVSVRDAATGVVGQAVFEVKE